MILRLPFTGSKLYVGKDAQSAREAVTYGAWQNSFDRLILGKGYRVGFDVLYDIYNKVADIKAAIKRKQNAVGAGGISWVNAFDENRDADARQSVEAWELLNRKAFDFRNFKNLLVRDLEVAGNAYFQKLTSVTGAPIGLKHIDPRTMAVIADKYGNVKGYKQTVMADSMVFDKDEIIHVVMDYSTQNPLLGLSPIESIVMDAKMEIEQQNSNLFFYENNAVPAHLLILKENLSPEQAKTLKEDVERNFKGSKNRWKTGIIPYVTDIKTVSPSQKDMQMIQSRQFTTKKVAVAFGVDPALLGYTEGVQRSNMWIIRREFYDNTIRPVEKIIAEIINNEVLPYFGFDKVKIYIDKSNYYDEKELADRTRADVSAGIMTINEARFERGYEPSENELADELLVNGIPLDDIAQETEEVAKYIREKVERKRSDLYNLLADVQ